MKSVPIMLEIYQFFEELSNMKKRAVARSHSPVVPVFANAGGVYCRHSPRFHLRSAH
jgi:hypothetical protein